MADADPASPLIGESSAMRSLRDTLRRLARVRLPVLITGESGTGKERAALRLHRDGPRRDGPFVAENCAALPAALLESLLFGHVRGAFTGADRDHEGLFRQAAGGTLFLDEIGEMPPESQARLLRVLQERELRPLGAGRTFAVNARIVAATNRDPERLVRTGRLRADLYYRLRGATIEIPPLRHRPPDVRPLARHFLEGALAQGPVTPSSLSEEALEALERYHWPGNVRELAQEIERAAALGEGPEITVADLSEAVRRALADQPPERAKGLEAVMIERALEETGGCVARAARRIGWTRQKLYRRMDRLGMTRRGGWARRPREPEHGDRSIS